MANGLLEIPLRPCDVIFDRRETLPICPLCFVSSCACDRPVARSRRDGRSLHKWTRIYTYCACSKNGDDAGASSSRFSSSSRRITVKEAPAISIEVANRPMYGR
jgi:hypothetical protein